MQAFSLSPREACESGGLAPTPWNLSRSSRLGCVTLTATFVELSATTLPSIDGQFPSPTQVRRRAPSATRAWTLFRASCGRGEAADLAQSHRDQNSISGKRCRLVPGAWSRCLASRLSTDCKANALFLKRTASLFCHCYLLWRNYLKCLISHANCAFLSKVSLFFLEISLFPGRARISPPPNLYNKIAHASRAGPRRPH